MVSSLGFALTVLLIACVSAQTFKKVSVLYEGKPHCTGSVVTDGYVRVKASDIVDLDDDKLEVNVDGHVYDVLALTISKEFDPETGEGNDQAVLLLETIDGLDEKIGTF